jgi:hypothetical protein
MVIEADVTEVRIDPQGLWGHLVPNQVSHGH